MTKFETLLYNSFAQNHLNYSDYKKIDKDNKTNHMSEIYGLH